MDAPFNPLNHPLCLTAPKRLSAVSAWQGHLPFALWLIQRVQPRSFVELGTHAGDSYCAFCQAVKHVGCSTKCFAVDTWQGDDHTEQYGSDILADLKSHHDPLYAGFSTLLQMTFDQARSHVADGSVDLLHIDGLHTYDAVRHDFETWLPKLSERGIVLFHDTAVKDRGFGVHQFWAELTPRFPNFEFHHSFGLGVLAVGKNAAIGAPELFQSSRPQVIREFFESLGSQLQPRYEIAALKHHVDLLNGEVDALKRHRQELEKVIQEMQNSKAWKIGTAITAPMRMLKRGA